jgi:uncharacterized protein YggE
MIAAGLAVLLAAVGLAGCAAGTSAQGEVAGVTVTSQPEGIHVTGQGIVPAVPDIVEFRLGVDAQAETVAEAQSQAAQAMTRVLAALAGNGIADRDIQTQHLSIRQVTRWDPERDVQVVIGYRVSNNVLATISDTDKAGAVVDAVVSAGGDLTRINGLSFSVDDPAPYREEAREKAMADAKARAEQLARLGGVRLGKPVYIVEGGFSVPTPVFRAEAAADMAFETPIIAGELDISLTVTVVYDILN